MPPFLLIDAGSTRIKWAVAMARGRIVPRGEMWVRDATAAEIRKKARQFPRHHVVLACVVPKLVPIFRHAFAGRVQVVRGDAKPAPVPFAYPRPAELGADRIAAAAAVHAEGKHPAIIVSCGTALAFTVLDRQGRLCGGAIAAGLQAQLDALLGAAAQLPATSLRLPRRWPPNSTPEAIRAGLVLGYRGAAKEIAERLRESLPGQARPQIILTGGDARTLRGVFGARAEMRPLLVLEGLRIIGARVFAPTP